MGIHLLWVSMNTLVSFHIEMVVQAKYAISCKEYTSEFGKLRNIR